MIEKRTRKKQRERLKTLTKLPDLDPALFNRIAFFVKQTHAEDIYTFLGETLYNGVVQIAKDVEDLGYLLRVIDLSINKNNPFSVPFDPLGYRVEEDRVMLEHVTLTTQMEFLYRTITEVGDENPCARVILEELYLETFQIAKEKERGFGKWENVVRRLETDLTLPNKNMQNYFVMLGNSGNDTLLGIYAHHLTLRDQGVTIKGLIDDTWREELESQSSEENIK